MLPSALGFFSFSGWEGRLSHWMLLFKGYAEMLPFLMAKIFSRQALYFSDISTLEKLTQFPQNNKSIIRRKQMPQGD